MRSRMWPRYHLSSVPRTMRRRRWSDYPTEASVMRCEGLGLMRPEAGNPSQPDAEGWPQALVDLTMRESDRPCLRCKSGRRLSTSAASDFIPRALAGRIPRFAWPSPLIQSNAEASRHSVFRTKAAKNRPERWKPRCRTLKHNRSRSVSISANRRAQVPVWPKSRLFIRCVWEPKIHLEIRVGADLPAVQCDRLGLQDALLNLVSTRATQCRMAV